ncbi:hypothetical protein LJ707_16745 [Mucilaginibacter sp. UR6-1]|uniref:hypothetical protein n=1 Tax=Mucilaginibacter sp. UR6-1 TaxID=1435643 RepID=UPI001E4CC5C1|nr:hypothetical protein [Mucilaginibacter sp. UR6-1]MCC8410594.1 hypothetical protein [Mucilaginibacter sp. UR6-1]
MNTKLIMTVAAVFLAAMGFALSFAADEIIKVLGGTPTETQMLCLQLLGAMYYAFALLNWMAKGAIIGGIYNRPVAIGNFTHFVMGSIVLTRAVLTNDTMPASIAVLAGLYVVLAVLFAFITFRHPGTADN